MIWRRPWILLQTLFGVWACGFVPAVVATGTEASPGENTQQAEAANAQDKIRLGVFYIDKVTGQRHFEGIQAGVDEHAFGDRVELVPTPYVNERQAVDFFNEATGRSGGAAKVDFILGPTESDVFLGLREASRTGNTNAVAARAESANLDVENPKVAAANESQDVLIPVISGLVTAPVGNEPSGWFFRTNVDVVQRARTIHRFLNKYWVHSIAILYANTEFGRNSEAAFAKCLTGAQQERYLPLIYDLSDDHDTQLKRILDARPGAVGFFGERDDINQLYNDLKELNGAATPYRPVFFTLLDAHSLDTEVDSLSFVSIADAKDGPAETDPEKKDDVVALGHDTATLVLNILEKLPPHVRGADLRRQFRDRLATRMTRSAGQPGTWKQMSFVDFKNTSRLAVYKHSRGKTSKVELAKPVSVWKKFFHRVGLVFSIWGWRPLLCVVLVLAITVFVVYSELRTLFEGTAFKKKFRKMVVSRHFFMLAIPHALIALAIYFVLAETGNIRYGNLLMAAIIAVGPWAFLKSALESSIGETLGLKRVYEGWRLRVDNELMKARFKNEHGHVNVIAYNNSQFAMRNALLDLYRNHPSTTEGTRLAQDLEQKLASEREYFERRRICARLLLRQKSWDELKAEGLVPRTASHPPLNPQTIVRLAAKHCTRDPEKTSQVQKLVNERLKEVRKTNPKRHDELKEFLDYELRDAKAPEGDLNVYIRFLFVLFGFDIEQLKQHELISEEDYEELKRESQPAGTSPAAEQPAEQPAAASAASSSGESLEAAAEHRQEGEGQVVAAGVGDASKAAEKQATVNKPR